MKHIIYILNDDFTLFLLINGFVGFFLVLPGTDDIYLYKIISIKTIKVYFVAFYFYFLSFEIQFIVGDKFSKYFVKLKQKRNI